MSSAKNFKAEKLMPKNKNKNLGQFQYLGRWVDKDMFRAFVYNNKGEEKLADSYSEFVDLTSDGIWFDSKEAALEADLNSKVKEPLKEPLSLKGKDKHGTVRSDS